MVVVWARQDLDLEENKWFNNNNFYLNNILLLVGVVGSVFGFVVTSCDDDFLGIRNNEVTEVAGANGLFAVVVDGLVSLAARSGGDATCCLFVFAPVGIERARCLRASLIVDWILFGAGGGGGGGAVGVVGVVDDEEDGSCPG